MRLPTPCAIVFPVVSAVILVGWVGSRSAYHASLNRVVAASSRGDDPQVSLRKQGWDILQRVLETGSSVNADGMHPPAWEQSPELWFNKCDLGLLGNRQCKNLDIRSPQPVAPSSSNPCVKAGDAAGNPGGGTGMVITQPAQLEGAHSGTRTLATILYNKAAASFISARQLQTPQGLSLLAHGVRTADCSSDFPPDAIIVKLIWQPVLHSQVWVYDSEKLADYLRGGTLGQLPPTSGAGFWTALKVAINDSPCDKNGGTAGTVSISCFYHKDVRCSDMRVAQPATACDQGEITTLVLSGMHVITADRPTWTWSTFYWTLSPSKDNRGSGAEHVELDSPWDHYAMDITSMTASGVPDPAVAFNPYLEGIQSGGLTSNCVVCHSTAQATVSGSSVPTHMLWSLANAQDPIKLNTGTFSVKVKPRLAGAAVTSAHLPSSAK